MSSIPAGAEVLILGLDPAGAECLRQLVQAGTTSSLLYLQSYILTANRSQALYGPEQ